MTTSIKLCFIFFLIYSSTSGQRQVSNCNRAVRSKWMLAQLDSFICVPKGYQVIDVYSDVDLNADGSKDKVISWSKIKMVNGDTVYYSFYFKGTDGSLVSNKTVSNLKPLYFISYSDDYTTGSKRLDSIKTRYVKPEFSEVDFQQNGIVVSFFVDASTLRKLLFTFSPTEGKWILTKEIQWFAPNQFEEDRKKEFDRVPKEKIKLDDFSILNYLGW